MIENIESSMRINRRDALKRMGKVMMSTAVAASGIVLSTSCQRNDKKRIVFYFTGTGNSLYVARQLAGSNGEVLSIPQMVKHDRYEFEADEIGLVYPIYGHMPPNMVRRFIKRAHLKAGYKFAVLTYGNRKCNAVEIWDDVSQQAENAFDYIATLIMVDNWLPNFDMNEQMLINKHIPENLQKITTDIAAHAHWHEPVTEEERQQHRFFMAYTGIDPSVGFMLKSERSFTVTDNCIGCGACVDVCPKGNYKLTGNGVKIEGSCEFCFACIQNCPQKAIQFAKNERDPLLRYGERNPAARYRNEHVPLMDIKRANSQF